MNYPEIKPNVEQEFRPDGLPEGWCCGEAQTMLKELIDTVEPSAIAEIGSFKGMSAYFMAKTTSGIPIYCIDHWKGSPEHERMGIDTSKLYETFIVNCWEYRDRIKPIRRTSIGGLLFLKSKGIKPDIIYVDGAHDFASVYIDIHACLKLFPDATICGDDWTLKSVMEAVQQICTDLDKEVYLYNERTWRLK